MPLYWRIGGMIISSSKMGHIQMTINLFICVEKNQNLVQIQVWYVYFLKDVDHIC